MRARGHPVASHIFRTLDQGAVSQELGNVCMELPLIIFEEKMEKRRVAKNLREARISTFIMESIDFRHYRWETWMFIHTTAQAGSVHDHVQGLAGKWRPNPMPAPRILYLSLVSESIDFHFPVNGDRTAPRTDY